ncbi:hypothetical protein Syun_015769 [Stephania yunnanensis]|uniref:Extra-large guanine nucleotide-binding protein 1-like n=1 Tax=Stephania yunnanensis TaxID=152371 RepID=A0AAP0JM61_9MAGN
MSEMRGLVSRTSCVVDPIYESEEVVVDYTFAVEYEGPPVSYEIPKAVPIDIKKIPVASIVKPTALCDKFQLPVVQPIFAPESLSKAHSAELAVLVSDSHVSPTSVIDFEHRSGDSSNCVLFSEEISSSSTLGFLNSQDQSCELLSDAIDDSGVLELSNGHECSRELSCRISSSDTLGISNGNDQSGEFGNSEILEFSKEQKLEILDNTSGRDWESNASALSSRLLSSDSLSFKAENCGNLSARHVKRPSVVSFWDGSTSNTVHEESSPVESSVLLRRGGSETKTKKGSCYRCLKGNRFTEKEACVVCDAKYCSNCVLRSMGSMPEGRKCVSCIGFPIDESKRTNLGKCSRMLKRLLSELEIQQIMKAEKLCETNQLQPEHVYVNGHQLCQEELDSLQSCPNPPAKLKPGRYWYDKVSGLWGKEGHKPCKIISPHMNVGGPIMATASNGNTKVFINNREITKVELRMLQLAGVQCAGNPHFWVNEDGSYQEEGQKNIKGNLWSKPGMKLLCTFLSLPIPSKIANPAAEEMSYLVGGAIPDYLEKRMLQKILLVGCDGSGTSTIFKQAKILYKTDPFSDEERENIKLVIQSNVYRYLGMLLEGREHFEEEILNKTRNEKLLDQSVDTGPSDEGHDKHIYSIGPRLKAFSDWLLKVMLSGNLETIFPAATREYAPLVEELWKDSAIQATFSRRSELKMLPSIASYFLERIVDISRIDYEPSSLDILYAEGITSSNGLTCMDFSFPHDGDTDTADQLESMLRYQLIRVQARGLGENCKWLEMFEDVRIAIFCVGLSDYDEFRNDGSGAPTNKMLASRRLFESIICHPIFEQVDFLLILNKFDLLEEKIEQVPLNRCEWFDDFNPVISRYRPNNSSGSNNASLAQQAFHYIAVKFKRHFFSLTGRKLYVSPVNAMDPNTVDEALRYAKEVQKWDEERAYFSISESIYSTELSSDS